MSAPGNDNDALLTIQRMSRELHSIEPHNNLSGALQKRHLELRDTIRRVGRICAAPDAVWQTTKTAVEIFANHMGTPHSTPFFDAEIARQLALIAATGPEETFASTLQVITTAYMEDPTSHLAGIIPDVLIVLATSVSSNRVWQALDGLLTLMLSAGKNIQRYVGRENVTLDWFGGLLPALATILAKADEVFNGHPDADVTIPGEILSPPGPKPPGTLAPRRPWAWDSHPETHRMLSAVWMLVVILSVTETLMWEAHLKTIARFTPVLFTRHSPLGLVDGELEVTALLKNGLDAGTVASLRARLSSEFEGIARQVKQLSTAQLVLLTTIYAVECHRVFSGIFVPVYHYLMIEESLRMAPASSMTEELSKSRRAPIWTFLEVIVDKIYSKWSNLFISSSDTCSNPANRTIVIEAAVELLRFHQATLPETARRVRTHLLLTLTGQPDTCVNSDVLEASLAAFPPDGPGSEGLLETIFQTAHRAHPVRLCGMLAVHRIRSLRQGLAPVSLHTIFGDIQLRSSLDVAIDAALELVSTGTMPLPRRVSNLAQLWTGHRHELTTPHVTAEPVGLATGVADSVILHAHAHGPVAAVYDGLLHLARGVGEIPGGALDQLFKRRDASELIGLEAAAAVIDAVAVIGSSQCVASTSRWIISLLEFHEEVGIGLFSGEADPHTDTEIPYDEPAHAEPVQEHRVDFAPATQRLWLQALHGLLLSAPDDVGAELVVFVTRVLGGDGLALSRVVWGPLIQLMLLALDLLDGTTDSLKDLVATRILQNTATLLALGDTPRGWDNRAHRDEAESLVTLAAAITAQLGATESSVRALATIIAIEAGSTLAWTGFVPNVTRVLGVEIPQTIPFRPGTRQRQMTTAGAFIQTLKRAIDTFEGHVLPPGFGADLIDLASFDCTLLVDLYHRIRPSLRQNGKLAGELAQYISDNLIRFCQVNRAFDIVIEARCQPPSFAFDLSSIPDDYYDALPHCSPLRPPLAILLLSSVPAGASLTQNRLRQYAVRSLAVSFGMEVFFQDQEFRPYQHDPKAHPALVARGVPGAADRLRQSATFIPQLVQLVNTDLDGLVAALLVSIGKLSPLMASLLISAIRAEVSPELFKSAFDRKGATAKPATKSKSHSVFNRNLCRVVAEILASMTDEDSTAFNTQFSFVSQIMGISDRLVKTRDTKKISSDDPAIGIELDRLLKQTTISGVETLPFDTAATVVGILPNRSVPLKSHSRVPLLVTFLAITHRKEGSLTSAEAHTLREDVHGSETVLKEAYAGMDAGSHWLKLTTCIFKTGDDVRQDQLALQLIAQFKGQLTAAGLGFLFLYPYRAVPIEADVGLVECVKDASSRDQIGSMLDGSVYHYYLREFGPAISPEFKSRQQQYCYSLAAYSVVSYLLQIKDRHNGNIMLDRQGRIIHIDFGFIFDISPGGDIRFEAAPFKLTREMIDMLDGPDSPLFMEFMELCVLAFLALRRNYLDLVGLVRPMLKSSLPCFKVDSVRNLLDRLALGATDLEATRFMRDRIRESFDCLSTNVYDRFQAWQNNINW
ncbi:Phosphatidylinositol 3- and 4-kinase [Carpediemonas membranifera]|uniref:Phosphatidylinositol 3- and 4-kinase n=1 Tax=Carpediemonas membranifera TaxID=201153 RepID=A0A8J6E5X1_9EUKA|nr:Phosphatidylinositol 3- and 4-kinase [Carpediemonas membranifera]|eukprot:KAG9396427.1 Phosphatidylinositol 3- and 4-kinase [Carpediemonas membranifera]